MSEPRIDASITAAQNVIQQIEQRVLFIGQKTSAGSAAAGTLVQNILNDNSEDTLFGAKSMLASMVRSYKLINKVTQIDCIPLSDGGGAAAAVGSIAFTGPATATGTLVFKIGSRINHSYSLPVISTDSATTIGANLAALINADTTAPVTASATTGTVTITAVNLGLQGNKIGVEVVGTLAGVGVTLTKPISGSGLPTLTNIFNVVGDQRYQTVAGPVEYGFSTYTGFLDARFNVDNQVLDGVAIVSQTDTLANLVTALTPLNSQSLAVHNNRLVNIATKRGSAIFELDYVVSAQFAAIRALRLTPGANIAAYVASIQASDQVGGIALSSLPYHNTPFPYLPVIDIGDAFVLDEETELNTAGGFILTNNTSRSSIVANRVLTTYKFNTLGVADATFQFLNLVDTASASREDFFNFVKATYAQTRLTTGDPVPGVSMVNTSTIAADLVGRYSTQGGPDFALVAYGATANQFFKDNLNVEILDLARGRVSAAMRIQLVSQLRDMSIPIEIVGTIGS